MANSCFRVTFKIMVERHHLDEHSSQFSPEQNSCLNDMFHCEDEILRLLRHPFFHKYPVIHEGIMRVLTELKEQSITHRDEWENLNNLWRRYHEIKEQLANAVEEQDLSKGFVAEGFLSKLIEFELVHLRNVS